jgi:hypothetical protein
MASMAAAPRLIMLRTVFTQTSSCHCHSYRLLAWCNDDQSTIDDADQYIQELCFVKNEYVSFSRPCGGTASTV